MALSERIFCDTLETPVQTTNFIDDHSLEQGFQACCKNFTRKGANYTPFDSSRRAESNGVTFSSIWDGWFFDKKFSKYRFSDLENFWSKNRPPRIGANYTPFDSARRDESNGINVWPYPREFFATRFETLFEAMIIDEVGSLNRGFKRVAKNCLE